MNTASTFSRLKIGDRTQMQNRSASPKKEKTNYKIEMSSYTHYNIKFKPKGNRKVNSKDYDNLKELLFSEKYHGENSGRISSSWNGMFVFELCEKSNSIVLETTPVRSHYLTDALDNIEQEEEYTIWSICTYEEGPDYLVIYDSRLRDNYYSDCFYFYDEINIHVSESSSWRELAIGGGFQKKSDKIYQYKGLGRYYSHNEHIEHISWDDKNQKNNLQNKCKLCERDNYILKNCHKITPDSGGYDGKNWYSDPIIWRFMNYFEKGRFKDKIERVEFKYKNKLVRLYDKGVYNECFMLDNWFNLDSSIFDNWQKNFEFE